MKDKAFEQKGLIVKILLQMALLTGVCGAAIPQYSAAEAINVNGSIIDIGSYASPCIVDWDNDGKQDLLVGEMYQARYGRIYFFRNTGTNTSPKLATGIKLKSSGTTALLPTC